MTDAVKPRARAFSMNGRGIANYMEAGAYRARGIIEDYAFPDDQKAKIIIPPPTKELILKYYRGGQSEQYLRDQIARHSQPVPGETRHARSKRSLVANAARHLIGFGPTHQFSEVRHRIYDGVISGLRVKASYDFLGTLHRGKKEKTVCLIFNVASDIANSESKLEHHAKIESEIAYEIIAAHVPLSEVWFVDLAAEKVVRTLKKPLIAAGRDVAVACDDILLRYKDLVARRSRGLL